MNLNYRKEEGGGPGAGGEGPTTCGLLPPHQGAWNRGRRGGREWTDDGTRSGQRPRALRRPEARPRRPPPPPRSSTRSVRHGPSLLEKTTVFTRGPGTAARGSRARARGEPPPTPLLLSLLLRLLLLPRLSPLAGGPPQGGRRGLRRRPGKCRPSFTSA